MTKEESLKEIRQKIQDFSNRFLPKGFDSDNPRVLLHEPTFGGEEISAAVDCMLNVQITMGEKVRKFESEYGSLFGHKNATMVNSGSSANLLALAALSNPSYRKHLKPGDEVIVPALSWSTSIWPVIQCGLVPVIVDLDPNTLNIDPNAVEAAISPKTKAILVVHVYGNPCDMSALKAITDKHDLLLIEDCCEAMGATYRDKAVGSFGSVGTFSFYYSHHITTFEGGMCVTDDHELAELMRILRAHGWVRELENKKMYTDKYPDIPEKFLFVNLGYNLRATEIQAAVGSLQLKKLSGFVKVRADNANYWRNELSKFDQYLEIQKETPHAGHSWFGFPITIRGDAPFDRQEITKFLEARGIETRPIIAGNMARQPAMKLYKHRIHGELRHADRVMTHGFSFGNHQLVDSRARRYVADSVKEFFHSKKLD